MGYANNLTSRNAANDNLFTMIRKQAELGTSAHFTD